MNQELLTEQSAREVVLPSLLHPLKRRRAVGALAIDAGLRRAPMPGSFGNGLPGTRRSLIRRARFDAAARQLLFKSPITNPEGELSE